MTCILFYLFFFIHWRLITLQYCSGFCHTLTWISHGFICIPHPTSLSTRSLWVFPVHQARALVSCIQPGLVICFTLDNIHVSMLFSWNIPPNSNDNLICKTEKETQMYRTDFWTLWEMTCSLEFLSLRFESFFRDFQIL